MIRFIPTRANKERRTGKIPGALSKKFGALIRRILARVSVSQLLRASTTMCLSTAIFSFRHDITFEKRGSSLLNRSGRRISALVLAASGAGIQQQPALVGRAYARCGKYIFFPLICQCWSLSFCRGWHNLLCECNIAISLKRLYCCSFCGIVHQLLFGDDLVK